MSLVSVARTLLLPSAGGKRAGEKEAIVPLIRVAISVPPQGFQFEGTWTSGEWLPEWQLPVAQHGMT